jgi:hypothetical protein
MSLPITTSPDITNLNFDVLYDISGGTPSIVLTNTSIGNPSGTTNLANCNWWYVVTDPNGTFIHEGTVGTPDVTAANWITLTLPAGDWPTPFGTPPYGQIVFSCSLPYRTTLYVQDSVGSIFSLTKATTICRPNGSTERTRGNFGAADAFAETKCNIAKIYATDKTNYTYQGRIGIASTSTWKLAYPMDANGNIPAPVVVTNRATVIFPVGYSAKGYQLNLSTFSTYDMGDGTSIKIQYKFDKVFAVYCNIDLCQLVCEIDKLYKLLPTKCGTVENTEVKDKLLRINTLLGQCFIGINQPLCGIDVPALIEEIKKIGGFTCNCGTSGGINAIGVTDGDITLTAVTTGAITASFTNVGNNYTLNLAVPGSTAGTLQNVTDNGNTTTNDMIVGNVSGAHTTLGDDQILIEKLGVGGVVAGIGLTSPSATQGSVWVGTVGNGYVYLRANAAQTTYVLNMPAAAASAPGQTLINDGSGNLSWAAAGTANLQAVTTAGNTTTNAIYGTGVGFAVTQAPATYTALATDFEILCDLAVASRVITLPNIVGQVYCIKLYGAVPSGRTVTIQVDGPGIIDNGSSIILNRPMQSVIVQCILPNVYSVLSYSNLDLNLQQVTDAGNTTTNTIISGSVVSQYSSVSAGVVLAANSTLASASLVATGSSSTLNLKSTGAAFSNSLKAEDGILAARVTQLPIGRSGTLAMIGNSVSPTVGLLTAAAGVGATLVVAAGSDDNKGRVTLTTGTGCSTGQLFNVVFNTPNPVSAFSTVTILAPYNLAALNAVTQIICTIDPLQFGASALGSPLVDSTVYIWNYIVQR